MKQTRMTLALVFGLLGILTAGSVAEVRLEQKPDINWKTVDGQEITNKTLAGKIVLVDFWATWCGPCMTEAPHMVELYKKFHDKNVEFVGISLDQNVEKMKKVAKEKGLVWPMVCSGKGWEEPIAQEWGVEGIPHTFILNPSGEVIWTGHPARLDKPLADAVEKYKKKG